MNGTTHAPPGQSEHELSRRGLLKGVGAAGAMLLTGACSSGSGGSSGEIRFLHNETDPPSVAYFKKTIAAYQKAHPKIKINMELVSTDGRLQRLKSLQAARQLPGVFKIVPEERYTFAKAGVIVPLDDVVTDIGKDQFVTGSLVPIDGKVYDVPYTINQFSVYFYRQDLMRKFSQNGVTSWSALQKSAKTATQDTNSDGKTDVFGTVIPAGLNRMDDIYFASIFWSHGGTYFDADFNVSLDKGDAAVAALTTIAALAPSCPPGIASYSYSDMVSTYLTGKVAQDVYAPRLIANVADQAPRLLGETRSGPLLAGESGAGVGYANPNSFAVAAKSFGNGNVDACKDFLHYLTSGERVENFSLTAYPHMIPPLKNVQEKLLKSHNSVNTKTLTLAKRSFDLTNTMDFTTEAGASADSTGLRLTGQFNRFSPLISSRQVGASMVQDVLIRKMSPKDAVQKAADALRAAVKDTG